MAITASRTSLGRDLEAGREAAASRGNASLMRKGVRQAKKDKDFDKALRFNAALASEGKAYGMTGRADDTSSIAQGRVDARGALASQMLGQTAALTGQTREGRIAAAKSAGTFDATRQKFNKENSGKKTMDEAGNIMDAPATPPAATTPPASTTAPPAATTPPASTTTPPAKETARVSLTDQLINGATTPQAKIPMRPPESVAPAPAAAAPAKRKGVIMDNGVDVSEDIRKGIAGDRSGAFYTGKQPDAAPAPAAGPDMNDPLIKSAKALENASKGASAAQAASTKTAQLIKEVPKASPVAAAAAAPEDNMSPEGRMKLINDAVSSLKSPTAKAPTAPIGALTPDEARRKNDDIMRRKDELAAKSAPDVLVEGLVATADKADKVAGGVVDAATDTAGRMAGALSSGLFGNAEAKKRLEARKQAGTAAAVSARAKGGPVKAGKPYLVGEEGPEIVVPDEDGEVLPNDKLRKKSRKELQKMLSKR